MSTSDDRPYDQESTREETTAGRAGGRDADDTGVERHAPSSATELWDHNAYGREDGDIGGPATSGPTDTRDPRGGAPAYNIDAGDDDAVRHGDDSGREGGTDVRRTGESLTGADATAGDGREIVGGGGGRGDRRDGRRDEPSGAVGQAFDQEAADRDATAPGAGDRGAPAAEGRGTTERGAGRHVAGDEGRDLGSAGAVGGGRPEESPSVVRQEERLQVGTERVETGRTRLRKYVVEEPVRAEQTLASEDVEEIRTPVTDEEREAFLAGQELTVGDDEVVLYREVPVVRTVRVPYERVRLAVRRTERTEVVEETVRQEWIDVEED
ncbi:YsnF/AvaK domain-containing protein [uncultured Kocuria sp.]|uniref:YsnF/AvaK domain-containing protein n=1 Tax=uncultured Kocuria sp. TaxID=259305 RepID=UPI002629DB50|nr:YsnF/AvaK domain-containing protein [uncultured Kocuria sp.]